jgi:vacuolar-type H+-ATPase subunit E/Vma4
VTEPALIEALRRQAADEVEAIWQRAHAEADDCRAGHARARSALADELSRARATLAADLERTTIADAERRARTIGAVARAELALRCREIATTLLPRFRDVGQNDLFVVLARDLPARPWSCVRVNPADEHVARHCFPQAAVKLEPSIAGGMEVDLGDGRISVSNTLETRLDAAWPELLPKLVSHVVGKLEHR